MKINGLQKLTLLDYPGHVACTVFLSGCNWRCPFCHNASLAVGSAGDVMEEDEFFAFLSGRRRILDGVAITGGEPLLRPDIAGFAAKIKELGFKVKLDTNGTRPDRLREMIDSGVVDYVAMDIKNSPGKYPVTTGSAVNDAAGDLALVKESAAILMSGVVEYEFRTTVVHELHEKDDFIKIGEWLRGAEKYFLQQFRDSGEIISPGLTSPTAEEMAAFADAVRPYIPSVFLRGV